MSDSLKDVGKFGFSLQIVEDENGKRDFNTKFMAENVAPEIIIMQTKVFLRNLEKGYFELYSE